MRRKEKFEVDEYYHVFNRGVEKRRIFYKKADYERFINYLIIFNTTESSWKINNKNKFEIDDEKQLVKIIAYCINPNHFHLILRENKEDGISRFMKKICTGYAMYFNKKNERSGILFQGRYKASHISTDDLLLYISAYVNCNSEIHGIETAEKYPWCSFPEYLNINTKGICNKDLILNQFKGLEEYKKFCGEKVVGMKEKKEDDEENWMS
jgi:putative transposase